MNRMYGNNNPAILLFTIEYIYAFKYASVSTLNTLKRAVLTCMVKDLSMTIEEINTLMLT